MKVQREYVLATKNTAQRQLNSLLENLNKQSSVIQIREPLHGSVDFSNLRELGFGNILTIELAEGEITDIFNLPPNLTHLICPKNLLFSLDDLPGSLQYLDIQRNYLTTIDLLELNDLEYLNISHNQFEKLQHLPVRLKELYCEDNKLTFLDLHGLHGLKTLHISDNNITIIENLPEKLVSFQMDNNPSIEFRNTLIIPKPEGKEDASEYEVNELNVNYMNSLSQYYKLKNAYEEKISKMKQSAYEKGETKKQKKHAVLGVKPQCITCKRPVGTIFSRKNNRLSAICGDAKNPCRLNIQLFTGDYTPISSMLYESREGVEDLKDTIIRQKLDTLFNYIGDAESIEYYKKELEAFHDFNTVFKSLSDTNNELYHSSHKNELTIKKRGEIFVIIERIRVLITEYKKGNNKEILKTAVQMQVEELLPEVRNLRMLENEILEMDNGELIKFPVILSKTESLTGEPPRVIKFLK